MVTFSTVLSMIVAIDVVCFGTVCWIGNNADLPDAALRLFKILRSLLCSVTSDKLVSSEGSESREGETNVATQKTVKKMLHLKLG